MAVSFFSGFHLLKTVLDIQGGLFLSTKVCAGRFTFYQRAQ